MKTFASVTEVPCTCEYLARRDADPDSPIEFDSFMNEFHWVSRNDKGEVKCETSIYHCPFCGGEAPQSVRPRLFTTVSDSENRHIRELFKGLVAADDITKKLGPAEYDNPDADHGFSPERDGRPPIRTASRYLRYSKLSETADVHIREFPDWGLSISLQGKYIGPLITEADTSPKSE